MTTPLTTTPLIETRGLSVSYGSRCAVHPVDLRIRTGESVAVVGRNGSGKSSLLRALSGRERAARGEVILHAGSVHHHQDNIEIAYVPQRSAARWELPFAVGDVVAAGVRRPWWRRRGPSDRAAVVAALTAVGLTGLDARPVTELSGGQAQRVLIARALVQRPHLVIMDEPFAGLDLETVQEVTKLLDFIVAEGNSVCCALHELDIARSSFVRTVALADGVVVEDGPTAAVLDAAGVERIFMQRVPT
ncbi:MAG: ATP-binding cassette domain-containing protein [Actinomycetia bacterium]|nr:ATP-binding cassette domain-containing protein [Actinomycetes bacterium]